MSQITTEIIKEQTIDYPTSDGQPMADNTLQFQWIVTIKEGLETLFRHNPQVFIAGDLLWYPVKGNNRLRRAPDAMVVFGRPKGYRGAYLQWKEADIPPQVVFEVLSPGNTSREMQIKFEFYERYGVEEYYVYDPHTHQLKGWQRQVGQLVSIADMVGWVSPRLEIRFDITPDDGLTIYDPAGRPFLTYVELAENWEQAEYRAKREHQRADQEHQRAEQAEHQAEREHQRADQEHHRAEQAEHQAEREHHRADREHQRAEQAEHQAEQERRRAEQLAAKLRAMGIDPDSM